MFAKTIAAATTLGLVLMLSAGAQAQDTMATDNMMADGMASDAVAPMMSDDELALCLEQAQAITFTEVAAAAEQACHDLHNGHDAMGGDAMGGDAMMGDDAMAPKQ